MNSRMNNEPQGQNINLISSGTKITGDIVAEGDIRIDGELKGNVKAKGRLVVGASGKIEGEIVCNNIEISGQVKGKIGAKELLSMKSSSKISGEIITGKLSVEPGSVFTGTCTMGNQADEPAKIK
ncbi:MAG: polymer-forming cytoskeletal protein [Prolixibacteraceae bacterium]|nr:polymer-forming cytoskeletal protein [Prolixibacteraceae bacterium]